MSTIAVSEETDETVLLVKGAPEEIQKICVKDTLPPDYNSVLTDYSQQGFRIIALAYKVIA